LAGATVEQDELYAPDGGEQAFLVPALDGGFSVTIDPRLTPMERAEGADAKDVFDLRLAHELAHTTFYVPGRPPARRVPWRSEEERWCDEVARMLTGTLAGMRRVA
jgi:hypothetical protein